MKNDNMDSLHKNIINTAINSFSDLSKCTSIEPVPGGMSGAFIYKIILDNKELIARISDPQSEFNNLEREYKAMRNGSSNNVGPHVYYSDVQAGIVIMDLVHHNRLGLVSPESEEVVKKFASFIKRLHDSPGVKVAETVFERTVIILSKINPKYLDYKILKKCLEIKNNLADKLNDPQDYRLSHCDINPTNLMYHNNDFCLIDWGSASQQNLYFDLAYSAMFFFFVNAKSKQDFLAYYFSREPKELEKSKYYLMQIFVHINSGIIFLWLCSKQNCQLLTDAEIDTLPNFASFMSMIGSGKVTMAEGEALQQLGLICLKTAVDMQSATDYETSIAMLGG